MRQSRYFLKTSKTFSEEEKIVSAKLLKQAGFIQESVAGRYYFLPAGNRVQQNIAEIIREEMDAAGAQEMVSPILHPLELWKETNRTSTAGFELMKVKDRRGSEFALGGTAEEMFVDLVRKYSVSYKNLPFHLYQFSPKFRDELRARGGLLRVREFIMKDGYSFHADESDFEVEYEKMKQVYLRIFSRLGIPAIVVASDNGYIGGEYCHELIVESEIGESKFFVTQSGDYAAHEDVCVFDKEEKNPNEAELELKEVSAKRGPTMEDGVVLHNLPLWRQIKDVLFIDESGRYVLAVIRGDFDVNELKLSHVAGTRELRAATDEEVLALGTVPGFISPVGIKELAQKNGKQILVVADDSLLKERNMYGGANKRDADYLNINYGRDYTADVCGDIALVAPGFMHAGQELVEKRGIEVGNVFQLGYHYTKLMKGAVYTDAEGNDKPYYMGCYGIGLGRSMAAIVEKNHDEKGIIWPESIAPFKVHLIELAGATGASELYQDLQSAGVEVLYDDRADVGAGAKFADADLIGIPYRLVVSAKTGDKVEMKRRSGGDAQLMSKEEIITLLTK
jgi:prolyl-tRNA synthetase